MAKRYTFYAIGIRRRTLYSTLERGMYNTFYMQDVWNHERWVFVNTLYESESEAFHELVRMTDGKLMPTNGELGTTEGDYCYLYDPIEEELDCDTNWTRLGDRAYRQEIDEFRIQPIDVLPSFYEPAGKGSPWFVGALYKKIPPEDRARTVAEKVLEVGWGAKKKSS